MSDVTEAVRGATVPRAFAQTVRDRPDVVALRSPDNEGWRELTWRQYGDQASRFAGALRRLGVTAGDRVVLMLRNRPEFHVADMGILLAGATPISIYNSSSPEQIAYVVRHADATVAIVDDASFLDRVLKVLPELGRLRDVVVVQDPEGVGRDVLRFDDLLGSDPEDLESGARRLTPDDLATIIYTSGTTGPPKAVMLTQGNVCWTAESFRRCLHVPWTDRRFISFLPMAHIAERMTTYYDHVTFGSIVTPCPDPTQLGQYLRLVRPEVVFGAPRVWEKLQAGIRATLAVDPPREAAFERALEVGRRAVEHRIRGAEPPADVSSEWAQAEHEVIGRVLELVGLDACELAITGAAPVPTEVVWFFLSMGLRFSEIYGLSETCGPHTWEPYQVRPGTVGPPMPGCEVRLEDDGEVLLRGGNIFIGYLGDVERTSEVLDDDGWLHTGDVGVVDDADYLRIVDRKKELIITAGGKNVSPANVEAALKAQRLVGQAVVVGDARPYVAALLVLDPEVARAWAASQGIDIRDVGELAAHPAVREEIERAVAAANAHFSKAEQVKRFAVLGEEWLPDSEQLTPTMKLKRREVNRIYADEIEALYR